jgi:hypothetical protein
MATSRTQDTEPEAPRVPTDPGLAPESSPHAGHAGHAGPAGILAGPPGAKKSTDPGLAPPSSSPAAQTARLEVVAPASLARPLDMSPELPPSAPRMGGDPTPVPPEDGLLNGLIASESEAYFHRAKAASASSGEAAAAFHAEPRALAQGNPTPPPEPPVLLRRSVEMDIAEASALAARPPPAEAPTDPIPRDLRRATPPDATIPLPAPRGPLLERVLAFAVAVMVVGIVGILVVRWLTADEVAAPHVSLPVPATAQAAQVPTSVSSPPPVTAAIPPPEPVAAPVQADPSPVVETRPTGKTNALPGSRPNSRVAPPSNGGASSGAPVEVAPPQKNDVKRSM